MNNKLKMLRVQRGLTQDELGKKVGLSGKAVAAWEQGRNTPKPSTMQRIEDFFGVPKEEIFFGAYSYKM
ncbi:helix-turn-helix transcriptional regulator [Lacticaseibacillus suibinensis]|uniref:helix-turn-helix transcriptional regulator n=1 Tax=Lacticaseibacillus suibinensis TaxID=2486011 RepID=UPI0019419C3D|nr:helix-turn-helix transcriptional regulator [Lacticaseibacillus suibinensis]